MQTRAHQSSQSEQDEQDPEQEPPRAILDAQEVLAKNRELERLLEAERGELFTL